MSKKHRNVVIAVIILAGLLSIMIFSNSKSTLVRQLQGPVEGTDRIFSFEGDLSVFSKENHIYTWQWNDLSKWPIATKPNARIIIPAAGDKIIYVPSAGYSGLVLFKLKEQKEIAKLDIPYGAECGKIRLSPNGKFGVASVLFKEGVQKGWFKLAVFDSELKGLSFAFQKDTDSEKFLVYDFSVTNDGNLLAGAGEKDRAWVFVTDVKSENILWEKVFSEYGQFTLAVFSPDGKILFVAEKVRYIIALDSTTGQTIKVFEMPLYNTPAHQKQNICCIAVSPDGRTLAADTEPASTVWFWDIKTGKKIASYHVSNLTVSSIAFSPDSKYLATGCMVSPEIKIWKVPQLKP
jgi:WD40 repeat protein